MILVSSFSHSSGIRPSHLQHSYCTALAYPYTVQYGNRRGLILLDNLSSLQLGLLKHDQIRIKDQGRVEQVINSIVAGGFPKLQVRSE